ncbi:glycosyltransferase family 2 protein [Lactococcus nasutitermitis]|uniref:Glycosyltransferase family 2 protein n=1 Tax=Lactococcus nasutitermitis TaxID=1652957 RepID=A0ABV9JGD5_9LACT|nr:glycosyltransferase family A protein [Lactococcus nasutitermitis]
MVKTLSIIIPFYGQSEKELAIPLGSINSQVGIDFSKVDVHLVNDGGKAIDIEAFNLLSNLEIHYHELTKNMGPGLARQYGIDKSEGEYLMFIDADDSLTALSLYFIFQLLKNNNPQIVVSRFYTETKNGDNYFYTPSDIKDTGAIYAKWFSRKYLKKIGLRFSTELRFFEDSFFVGTALICSDDNMAINNEPAYIYRNNPHSLTNSLTTLEQEKGVVEYVKQMHLRLEMIQRIKPELLDFQLKNSILNLYFDQKKHHYDKKLFNLEFHKMINSFKPFFKGYTSELQYLADIKTTGGEYKGLDTHDLKAMLNSFIY